MVISKTPPTQGLAGVKNLRTPSERPSDGLPQGSSSVSRCLHKRCSRIKSAFASYQATRRHRLCMLVARSRSDGRAALVRGCIGVGFALAASLTYVPLCLHVRNWHTRCRKMIVNKRVLAITGTSSAHGTQQEEHCRGSHAVQYRAASRCSAVNCDIRLTSGFCAHLPAHRQGRCNHSTASLHPRPLQVLTMSAKHTTYFRTGLYNTVQCRSRPLMSADDIPIRC